MEKYDTSQLTEFPRFEEESTQSGVSTFFNKLWKFPIFSPSETAENLQNKALTDAKQNASPSEEQSKPDVDDMKTETGAYAVEFEGRSLPNVLKRISSLIALGSGGGTRYADTELARYWMPDDISRECYECAARFSALRRRHHCRVCGQIFCSRCCSQRVPGQIFGCAGGLRVCTYCCNVVLTYLRERDDMPTDLRALHDNLQVKFPENRSPAAALCRDNFVFAREQEERGDARRAPREPLQDVFKQLAFTLPTQHHRYRLVRYNGVWRGCDVLQWVMDNTNNKTRVQATMVCQNLLSAGYMECMTELPRFADYALYKPIVLPPRPVDDEEDSPEECKRMVESVSSYCLDLNLGDSSARLIKAPKAETKSSPSSEEDNPVLEHSDGYTESKNICKAIVESGEDHLKLLMRQCLARESLSASWLDVLYPLCQQAAEITMPDLYGNDMDVRNYVQVKKVPGGGARDSCVVHGVVITKNVAHRGMPQQISNPTVLLLDCSIAYQRVEGKLTSLEPVLMQEQEYLVRCAARITALRPRVVLVRGSAARAVQDALRLEGVALAAGVPERALRRAARCARAETVTSIDARIGTPRLGTCKNFYVKDYSSKTLMVLEGCSEPHLGCCILLRGASLQELVRVKKVVKFMLLACYNWKLEKTFLGDIEAILPEPGMTFDDDNDNDVFNDKNDATKTNENRDGAADNYAEMNDELINESFRAFDTDIRPTAAPGVKNNESISNIDTDVTENTKTHDAPSTYNTKTNDSVTKTNDNVTELNDNVTEPNDSVTKPNDSVTKPNDSATKPNDSVTKTNDESKKTVEIEDPLQKAKAFVRKADSDKNLSCGVPIRDFSDPLRATRSEDDDVFLPKIEAKLKADDAHGDRWCSDDVVLSMSPNVVIPAPYLETEAGRKCPLRAHFPRPLLAAPPAAPPPHTPRAAHRRLSRPHSHVILKEAHPFIEQPIKTTCDDPALRAALAHYRATGCRLLNSAHTPECGMYKPTVLRKVPAAPAAECEKPSEAREPLDPLSPENHQRLSLLLYSYSNKSANVPDFCVNPWIATMEMYGKHDISLGAFLEKYCFNGDYKCTSSACNVPMNQHLRRFVHGDVCITITCNTVGHSNVDKLSEEQTKQVMFWSRCETCGAVGRASRLSRGALALSLAQYVRVRCCAPRYVRARTCTHPVHAHAHAFVSRLTTACFRFSKISTFDIALPPDVICTRYDTKHMRDSLINQLNDLMLKGHETFTGVSESEAERDYQAFKQHMEQIHLALTSSHLHQQTTLAAVVRSLWSVSDRIISGEKMLRDAQDKWSSPARPAKPQPECQVEEKSDFEDSSGDVGNDSSGTEEDEEKGDKKTVRQILSQLLSNNQPANQCGMIISSGLVPVVVMAGEIGSVIAATLASVTYQRTLRAQKHTIQTEQEEAECSSAGKERADAVRAARPSDHIEVLLKVRHHQRQRCRSGWWHAFARIAPRSMLPHSDGRSAVPRVLRAAVPPAAAPAAGAAQLHPPRGGGGACARAGRQGEVLLRRRTGEEREQEPVRDRGGLHPLAGVLRAVGRARRKVRLHILQDQGRPIRAEGDDQAGVATVPGVRASLLQLRHQLPPEQAAQPLSPHRGRVQRGRRRQRGPRDGERVVPVLGARAAVRPQGLQPAPAHRRLAAARRAHGREPAQFAVGAAAVRPVARGQRAVGVRGTRHGLPGRAQRHGLLAASGHRPPDARARRHRLHPHVHVGQEAGTPGEEEPWLRAAHGGLPGAVQEPVQRRVPQVLPAVSRALGPLVPHHTLLST